MCLRLPGQSAVKSAKCFLFKTTATHFDIWIDGHHALFGSDYQVKGKESEIKRAMI